jgi:hypothetical protein
MLSAHCAAQPGHSYLKPGDILPPLAGQALTGKWLDIASAFGANPAVVVFPSVAPVAATRRCGLNAS